MDIFKDMKLFSPDDPEFSGMEKYPDEHSVIINFKYGINSLDPLHELDKKLDARITEAGVGHYDWHEIAIDDSHGSLFMYGKNAEILFKTVLPILSETEFMKGAIATLRFGPPGEEASEIDVELE